MIKSLEKTLKTHAPVIRQNDVTMETASTSIIVLPILIVSSESFILFTSFHPMIITVRHHVICDVCRRTLTGDV